MLYIVVAFAVLCGLVSLGVDYGRVTLDKAALQVAADAAARQGAFGLQSGKEFTMAINAAATNSIEGKPVVLEDADIQVGFWNTATSTFTPTNNSPNAVQVSAQLSAARGTAVPTLFASLLGNKSCDVRVVSTAMIVFPVTDSQTFSGKADPWLAGMPNGTTANFYSQFGDSAPNNSPAVFSLASLTPGQPMEFNFAGNVTTGGQASVSGYGPDGNVNDVFENIWALENGNSEHGIANVMAPLGAIIGVYLNDSQPDSTAAPAALDFSTAASRDFATLSPQLKQPFFIGDGLRSDGTQQHFVVPTGATRLYIGVMDFQQWSDNGGSMQASVTHAATVTLVK
jgi:Flp pilus assembly protein TadG